MNPNILLLGWPGSPDNWERDESTHDGWYHNYTFRITSEVKIELYEIFYDPWLWQDASPCASWSYSREADWEDDPILEDFGIPSLDPDTIWAGFRKLIGGDVTFEKISNHDSQIKDAKHSLFTQAIEKFGYEEI